MRTTRSGVRARDATIGVNLGSVGRLVHDKFKIGPVGIAEKM